MKTFTNLFKLGFMILLLFGGTVSAQEELRGTNKVESLPLKFGNDIIIDNNATEDQRSTDLAIAFNGWLYSVYTANTTANGGYMCRVSKDNGITWSDFHGYTNSTRSYKLARVMVVGSDTSNLDIYLLLIYQNTSDDSYSLYCDVFDKNGTFDREIITRTSPYIIYDADMANDFEDPAYTITPYSVGFLYSKYGGADSLIYECSTDGGVTLSAKQFEHTYSYYGKVALSFGISTYNNYGRYFMAYEQKNTSTAKYGHIYYTSNISTIDGALNTPVCLDSLSSPMINLCSDPSISAQQNSSFANDSNRITVVVTCTRNYGGVATDGDILGFYNHEAAGNPGAFTRFDIKNSGVENDMESFISYDRVFNNFLVTYYDSTNQQLPFTVKHLNLASPDTWTDLTAGYNDQSNMVHPYPIVRINHAFNQVGFVWAAEAGTMGQAMFDAEYSTAGINDNADENKGITAVYPNPNKGQFTVTGFSDEDFTLDVFNILGINIYSDVFSASQEFRQPIDLGGIASGQYILRFVTSSNVQTFQIIVQ